MQKTAKKNRFTVVSGTGHGKK